MSGSGSSGSGFLLFFVRLALRLCPWWFSFEELELLSRVCLIWFALETAVGWWWILWFGLVAIWAGFLGSKLSESSYVGSGRKAIRYLFFSWIQEIFFVKWFFFREIVTFHYGINIELFFSSIIHRFFRIFTWIGSWRFMLILLQNLHDVMVIFPQINIQSRLTFPLSNF